MEHCEWHAKMQERVGSNETEVDNLKHELEDIKCTLKEIKDRLDNRYPASIIWIMSLMSGALGIMGTAIVTQTLR